MSSHRSASYALPGGRSPRAWIRRFFGQASAAAGRFAGPVAGAPEDAGEDVGFPVEHVGIGVAPLLAIMTNVFGDVGVRWTGPLAVDNFVEVVRVGGVGRLHGVGFQPSGTFYSAE